MSDTVYVTQPARYFSCYATPERQAVWAFGGYPLIPRVYLFDYELNAIFLAFSPLWWEKRRDAFVGNFGLSKQTIEIDGVEVTVYFCPVDWALEVNVAAQNGDISLSMPKCIFVTGYNPPV